MRPVSHAREPRPGGDRTSSPVVATVPRQRAGKDPTNMQASRRTRRSTVRTARLGVASLLTATITVAVGPSSADAAGFSCSGSDATTYSVVAGDSWYAIAADVEVTPAALLEANDAGLSDVLLPGDRLCLPAGAASTCSSYQVDPGDSWYGIAERAGTSLGSLLDANGADTGRSLHPGQEVCLPAGASTPTSDAGASYTVAAGDSWYGIADRAGVSLGSLLDANASTASSLLLPGDDVRLPAGATAPSAPSTLGLSSAPVRGACWFSDTWGAARSGGRSHQGVDIIAASGASVRAVVDGQLTRRAWAQPGLKAGNAWRLTAADGTYYFYAHLLDFAPGLQVGSTVEAGDIIGFVGSTGNAATPHLHFEIHPRGGSAVNPYSSVLATGECGRAIG